MAQCGGSPPRSFARGEGHRSVVGQHSDASKAERGGRQSAPKLVAWPRKVHLSLGAIGLTEALLVRTWIASDPHAVQSTPAFGARWPFVCSATILIPRLVAAVLRGGNGVVLERPSQHERLATYGALDVHVITWRRTVGDREQGLNEAG